jgi:signal transduction histidine kinase
MIRPWQIILAFGLCLALVVGAMTWVSWTALKLDQAQAQARRQAVFEEDVRLALWRMDSALAPLIARENSRPYFAWYAFYPAERPYASMFGGSSQDELLVPSPLLMEESPDVLLYFQYEPSGELTSPQVPPDRVMPLVQVVPFDRQRVAMSSRRLREVAGQLKQKDLLAVLPCEAAPELPSLLLGDGSAGHRGGMGARREQGKLSSAEYEARLRNVQQAAQQSSVNASPRIPGQDYFQNSQSLMQMFRGPSSGPAQVRRDGAQLQSPPPVDLLDNKPGFAPGQVGVGLMRPLWCGQYLILARQVVARGQSYVQGCWLDWTALRSSLLDSVRDVLPAARLEPVQAEPSPEVQGSRMLAALPVRLLPGEMPAGPDRVITPIRLSLLLAWGCVLLAAGAVAVLLAGTVSLSERRAAFVSAVTHELRTPLTTLRMYAEMLAAGMIGDPDKRQQYLDTLQREADRLGHLVENVLAYARLERGRSQSRIEVVPLDQLLSRVTERLTSRAAQAGMQLSVSRRDDAAHMLVKADQSAVEQILFNLVDNACKYAASAENRGIELSVASDGRKAFLRVRDHGPGISMQDARRLFRPFSKSARDAANSAPGVGLGLALSRRLAHQMNGDLRLDPHVRPGACFVLTLPTVHAGGRQ